MSDERKKSKQENLTQGHERVFGSHIEMIHDLYKLEVNQMQQNKAIDGQPPEYYSVDHCHWFHTIDSDGKELTLSTSVGNHFHIMKVTKVQGKAPHVECVSGPMKFATKKNPRTGKKEKVMIPAHEAGVDDHTHEVKFIKSDKLKPRIRSAEMVKVANMEAEKAKPLDGALL